VAAEEKLFPAVRRFGRISTDARGVRRALRHHEEHAKVQPSSTLPLPLSDRNPYIYYTHISYFRTYATLAFNTRQLILERLTTAEHGPGT